MRHPKTSCTLRQFLYALLILGFSQGLQAQTNAVANPGFASNFDGWGQYFGRIGEWSMEDAAGAMDSGSALLANEGVSDGVVPFVLHQCFEVGAGAEIDFGGDMLVPNGQPSGTTAYIFVEAVQDSNCEGPPLLSRVASSAVVGDWRTDSNSITTPANTQSIRLALGVFKPNGESADAEAYFDNIFVYLPENGGGGGGGEDFVINPAMSASFFNPAESGHGIMIHLMDANTAWMCWFTFTLTGEPAWICAVGTISGDTITFDNAFVVEGGAFPPNFDPSQIMEIPWGSIVVVFSDCDNGIMTWVTSYAGFTSGSMPLARLTPLWGNDCP